MNRETHSEALEQLARESRFQQTLAEVIERHPDLEADIRRSLLTPQLGEYHNEGPRMDSHIKLIIETINNVQSGKFPEDLEKFPQIQAIMRQLVSREGGVNAEIIDYAFLHDIAKPDCLTLKLEGEKDGREITWEQWQEIETSGEPYMFSEKSVKSISYFHDSEGSIGQHGNKGAERLKTTPVPEDILAAMKKHEVAYQFEKINAATYEEHFVKPGFTSAQQGFILLASYIDTMASLRLDGKADLSNFLNLLRSRENYELIQQFVAQGAVFRPNDLQALKKRDQVLTPADVKQKMVREKKYNMGLLSEKLDGLITEGTINPEEKAVILELVVNDQKNLGKQFGAKMKSLRPLLEICEIPDN